MRLLPYVLCIAIVMTGCAGTTPRNQSVSFSTPDLESVMATAEKQFQEPKKAEIAQASSDRKPSSSSSNTSIGIDKKGQVNQETYQAVQNSLVGVTGKLADIRADIGKALEVNSKITGIEGDIAAIRAEQISIKTQLMAEITAEVRAELKAEINGIKATFNTNSNLPLSFMIGLVAIVLILGGGLIFVIYQNSRQGATLKALAESSPVIVPLR